MHFYKYFLGYIFKAKTRQKLLFMAIVGLVVSSFSLVVIQGIMSGLQSGLIKRSKNVQGSGVILIHKSDVSNNTIRQIKTTLSNNKVSFYEEYEIELLLKNDDFIRPVILHGVNFKEKVPDFLKNKDLSGIILGTDVSTYLNAYYGSQILVTSPVHTDSILGELPRSVTARVSDFYMSELSEIDKVHTWVRLGLVQNLIRKKIINTIRIFDVKDWDNIEYLLKDIQDKESFSLKSWEQMNHSLVWALNLETNVMLFLFISMSFLVAITITSGFMIFFDKVKVDLISFWILGQSQRKLMNLSYFLTHLIGILFCLTGVLLGISFLMILQKNNLNFMPDFFVERSIPVKLNMNNILISFFVPYLIATIFSYFSFNFFKKENKNFLKLIRKVG